MANYREILRLQSLGNSQRSIALEVHSSRDTVADVIKAADVAAELFCLKIAGQFCL